MPTYLLCKNGQGPTMVIYSCQMQCSGTILPHQVDVLGKSGYKLLHATGEKESNKIHNVPLKHNNRLCLLIRK